MSTPFPKSITSRLPAALVARIDRDAKGQQSKRSEIIRRILKAHYDAVAEEARLAKEEGASK